jgi:hypothetical protein
MVECGQVNEHRQDLVIVVLAGAAGRQEPQFSCALHGWLAISGLERLVGR